MIKCYLALSCYTSNCEKSMRSVRLSSEAVVQFRTEGPAHKLQNTLFHLPARSVHAP